MKFSFIIPPSFDHKQPAERTAGCTRVVYLAPNIYELYAAAVLESDDRNQVFYHDFIRAEKNENDLVQFLKIDDSDAYLLWAVNLSLNTDLKTIELINRHRPGKKIILLGPGPTFFIDKYLISNNIIIIRGEPEITLRELSSSLNENRNFTEIKGLSYIGEDNRIVNNPPQLLNKDLDSLPFPARHLLDNYQFHNPKLKTTPYTTMITSRNCPYHCIYCVPSSLTFAREIEHRRYFNNRKPPIGFRSPENVEKEVELLASQGYKAIGFMDDNFIWNEERTVALCKILKKHGIIWGCQARVDAITEPIAKVLAQSGCMYVDLGIESFDDNILKYIKKGITAQDIINAIRILHKYKVPVKLNVLIGSSPLETKATVKYTLKMVKKLKVDQVMFNIVSPFPGTEFYELCKKNSWIKGGEYSPTDVQRESILNLPYLSSEEMERLLFKNNLSYFISPAFIFKQIFKFRSFKEFGHAFKALKIKLFG